METEIPLCGGFSYCDYINTKVVFLREMTKLPTFNLSHHVLTAGRLQFWNVGANGDPDSNRQIVTRDSTSALVKWSSTPRQLMDWLGNKAWNSVHSSNSKAGNYSPRTQQGRRLLYEHCSSKPALPLHTNPIVPAPCRGYRLKSLVWCDQELNPGSQIRWPVSQLWCLTTWDVDSINQGGITS